MVSPERTGGGGGVDRRDGAVMNISRVTDVQQSSIYALFGNIGVGAGTKYDTRNTIGREIGLHV